MGTNAARNYFESYASVNSFFDWLMRMTFQIDHFTKIAHDALQDTEHDSEKKANRELDYKSRRTMTEELKTNRQILLEIMLVRHTENYLNYLSELLAEIFVQRPETLRSSDQVEVADVLRHDSLASFIRATAERKVDVLCYKSIDVLRKFFADRFGLDLFDDTEVQMVVEAMEIRNIAVHNRCTIDERYCNRTGTDTELIGTTKSLGIERLESLTPLLFNAVKRLDKAAKKKLGLKGTRFKIERPHEGT